METNRGRKKLQWLQWLFDASQFVPRSTCGKGWTELLIIMSRSANLWITAAYLFIPANLFVIWYYKRKDMPKAFIIPLFIIFIVSCGFSHLTHWIVFYWPAYRFFVLVDMVTAIVSTGTALIMPFVTIAILSFPTIKDLERLVSRNEYLNKMQEENRNLNLLKDRRITRLEIEVEKLLEINKTLGERGNLGEIIDELRAIASLKEGDLPDDSTERK